MKHALLIALLVLVPMAVLMADEDQTEVELTDSETIQLELAGQKEVNARSQYQLMVKEYQLLELRIPKAMEAWQRIQKKNLSLFRGLCEEKGLDPDTCNSTDLKRLTGKPLPPEKTDE